MVAVRPAKAVIVVAKSCSTCFAGAVSPPARRYIRGPEQGPVGPRRCHQTQSVNRRRTLTPPQLEFKQLCHQQNL